MGWNIYLLKIIKLLPNFIKKENKFIPKDYVLFNIDTFNTWYNDVDNRSEYAHKGIYLRVNKLSFIDIEDYLLKCHNVEIDTINKDSALNFYHQIINNWNKQLKK
jgi:hypothetical protein